ncbi:efflux RND transporter periplasmic adaptor subunit [Pyramidobacter sp.]|uniref:efflux RND transporter periplasmic adaptor subunit n=1 Tax=Pyramidobacter sp. TaxID=1943581 RepID=UPI00332F9F23
MKTRTPFIKTFAAIAALSLLAAPTAAEEPPLPVKTLFLGSARSHPQRHYYGTVQGSQRVNLSFRVPGPLVEFPVEMGSRVAKGDLIGRIDPRDFRTRLSDAQSRLSQTQARYGEALNNFRRYDELYKKQSVSQAQYDRYKTALDVARSALKTAEASVAAAQDALADTELRAPFGGVIVARMAENFQDVQAKQPVASLQNLDTVEIVIRVSEEDIANIAVADEKNRMFRLSEKVSLDLEATLDELPGQSFRVAFKEVGAQSDPRTQTYPVTVTMPQPKSARILPGMAVNVTASLIGGETGDPNFYVPLEAVVGDVSGRTWVWRCGRGGDIARVPVTLGDFRGSRIQITGELAPGDQIVTVGARGLREGQKVRVVD